MKKLIQYICYKIYAIGEAQYSARNGRIRRRLFETMATLDPTAVMEKGFSILNHQNDPSKLRVGANSHLRCEVMLSRQGGEVIIGDNCFIGDNSKLWSAKKITIGNRVLISHNVNIHDNISHPLESKERHMDFMNLFSNGPESNGNVRADEIVIEDDAWIGFNATILKGVTIGKGAIIGADTIVMDDVPPYAIVVNNIEQRIIKYTT